jgi:AcrR family transcriptional regulator
VTASRTTRANPTYYDGDLRRDLLDAALELIDRQGPSAVSLRSLARRLGVSHAAPANHFPDKAALFTAIAVEGFELLAAAIRAAVRQAGPEATAGQRLGAAGRAYTGFAVAHPAHFAVMWQRDLLHRDDPALAAAGQATFELLLAGVRDVQGEGWAAGADQRTVAYLAWSVVHGLAALWLGGSLDDDRRPFEEIAGEVGALLGRALAPRLAPVSNPTSDAVPNPSPAPDPPAGA